MDWQIPSMPVRDTASASVEVLVAVSKVEVQARETEQ